MASPSANMERMEINSRTARTQRPCSRWPSPGTSQPAIKTIPAANPCEPASDRAAFSFTVAFVVGISNEYIRPKDLSGCVQRRTSRFAGKARKFCALNTNNLSLYTPRHSGFSDARHHVHLAAHAKLREINSRLHGKAGVWQYQTLIMRFKIIQMRTVAVDLGGNVVTCAVGKI